MQYRKQRKVLITYVSCTTLKIHSRVPIEDKLPNDLYTVPPGDAPEKPLSMLRLQTSVVQQFIAQVQSIFSAPAPTPFTKWVKPTVEYDKAS
jgi:hypothetical protein